MKENFQVLITFDKNLEYQQNFSKFPIIVLTINAEDNTYLTLKEFVLTIRKKLKENLNPGVQIID